MKKLLKTIVLTALHALVILLVPLNIYVCDIDEAVALGASALWLIIMQLLFWKKTQKKAGWIALDILIFAFMFEQVMIDPYWNGMSQRLEAFEKHCDGEQILSCSEALDDFDTAMKYLKRIHPLTYKGLPEDVEEKALQVRKNIEGRENIATYELSREIESVFAMFDDGHTHCDEEYADPHYMKYSYINRKAGLKISGINGISFEEFLDKYPGLVSYETESYGVKLLKTRISTLEGLRYLGVDINGEITYNYVDENGENVDFPVTAADFLTLDEYYDFASAQTGEDLRAADEDRGFVYYDIDEENSLAVLTLNSCNYNDTYKKTLSEMFKEVKEKGIRNVAVDLRNNPGGSSMVADEFITYLPANEYKSWASEWRMNYFMIPFKQEMIKNKHKSDIFDGNVYILTSVASYSAAMDFAMLIKDNGLGTIIGEPCGNLPASYGEVVCYRLPHSGVYMQLSEKSWHRVDTSKEDEPIMPDISCPADEAMDVLKEAL